MSGEESELDEDLVTLRVRGLEFAGVGGKRWGAVTITTSLVDLASSFSLKALGVFATEEDFIREGDEVEVFVGPDLLITGYVDDVEHDGDAENASVEVSGRSRTCDLFDCSAPLGTWSGLTLLKLLQTLIASYRIDIVDEAGVGGVIVRSHRTEEGEFLFDAIDRLGRDHSFLATDDGAGRLVLTRAGAAGRATDKIMRGVPGFISGGPKRSMAERYSHIVCMGQSASDLEVDTDAQGGAEDVGVTRFRELIIKPERGVSKADAAARAAWEATTRAAKALEGNYVQRGWRQAGGAVWKKNQIAEVFDGFGRLFADLLIVGLTFTIDPEAGRLAAFRVGPPEGFKPQPVRTRAVDVTQYEQAESTAPEVPPELEEDE